MAEKLHRLPIGRKKILAAVESLQRDEKSYYRAAKLLAERGFIADADSARANADAFHDRAKSLEERARRSLAWRALNR